MSETLEETLEKLKAAIGAELDPMRRPVNVPKVQALEWVMDAIRYALPYVKEGG